MTVDCHALRSIVRRTASYFLATFSHVNCSTILARAAAPVLRSSVEFSRAQAIGLAYDSGLSLSTRKPSLRDRASLLFGMSRTTGGVPHAIASRIVVGRPSRRDGRTYTQALWYSSTSLAEGGMYPTIVAQLSRCRSRIARAKGSLAGPSPTIRNSAVGHRS